MKKIFMWLLNRYSNTEKERITILRTLNNKVREEYSEQNAYGNTYNFFIEFIMANDFIINCVKEKTAINEKSLNMIKIGISNTFDEAIEYIDNEVPNK